MISKQLESALLERKSNEIDAAWIKGIRKSWQKAIDPAKRLNARSPHSETKIDMDKIQRTADESISALKKVLDYIEALRRDLLFNKGFWTIRRVEKGKHGGSRRDPPAKVVQELDIAQKAIDDNISRINGWKNQMSPEDRSFYLDNGLMYQKVSTDLESFNQMLNSVVPTGADMKYEGIWAADAAISKRLLGVLSSRVKVSIGNTIALDPIEPEVVHLGKMTVIFQDTPNRSPHSLDPAGHKEGRWRGPKERGVYLRKFNKGIRLLQKHGFGYLCYGKVYVFPESKAGENQYDASLGVAARYHRSGDYVTIYSDSFLLSDDTLIHEIGHRYWFKFMSAQDQHNFGKWFNAVPATSKYGALNTVEDFAEVFADYVWGRKLNRAQHDRLKQFFGRKRKLESRETSSILRLS